MKKVFCLNNASIILLIHNYIQSKIQIKMTATTAPHLHNHVLQHIFVESIQKRIYPRKLLRTG